MARYWHSDVFMEDAGWSHKDRKGVIFWAAWMCAAVTGWADSWGSMECVRAWRSYADFAQPLDAEQFLREWLNMP